MFCGRTDSPRLPNSGRVPAILETFVQVSCPHPKRLFHSKQRRTQNTKWTHWPSTVYDGEFWPFSIFSHLLSDGGRSADFPDRRKLLSHNRAANWVQVGVRTMLRTGKSALRDLRPRSLTGYSPSIPSIFRLGAGQKYRVW